MADINITRIKDRLFENFKDLIDMTDYPAKVGTADYEGAFLSRSYGAYAISQITGIDFDLAAQSVTDGYHDNGIDAIFDDTVNNRLILLQSKWSNEGKGTIKKGEVLTFLNDGVEKILSLELDSFNDKVKQKKDIIESCIKNFNYKIVVVLAYSSSNSISNECKDIIERFLKNKNEGIEELIEIAYIDKNKTYAHMASLTAQSKINLEEVILNNWGPIEIKENIIGYYGTISAISLAKVFEKYGNRILEKNIRFFKGDTEVNKGIISVLEEEPEYFYLYNNGIKIISDEINRAPHQSDRKNILLKINGASIVNGAQTTGSLYELFKKDMKKLNNVSVHVQIIELKKIPNGMGEKITKLSNTQNKIESKDFATQDKEQERIKRDLAMDNIEYLYRGEKAGLLDTKTCTLDDATIALGCLLDDVTISTSIKKGFGGIFENLSKAPYKTIFNSATNVYALWNSVVITREVERIEKEFQNKTENPKRLVSIHANRFILHIILQDLKSKGIDFYSSYLDNGNIKELNLSKNYENIVSKIILSKQKLFPDAYPANVFKNNSRAKEIKDDMEAKTKSSMEKAAVKEDLFLPFE